MNVEDWPPTNTKYGWQPARVELFKRRISSRSIARELEISSRHVENALRGKAIPCPKLREWLPGALNIPLRKLFSAEVLSHTYMERTPSKLNDGSRR